MSSTREREALDQAIARGSEQLKQGRLDEAQRTFHQAHEIDPDNTKVLALLGLAYFRAQKFAEARPIYEELVERAATDAAHRLNLGLVYLKLGQGDLAITALEASRALDPSQGRAISYLGLAYARAGRYNEAYHSFLLAGQNELASEIEVNVPPAEREAILAQLGRTPAAHAAPLAPATLPDTARTAVPQLPPRRSRPQPQPQSADPAAPAASAPPAPPAPPAAPAAPAAPAVPAAPAAPIAPIVGPILSRRDRHTAPTAPPPLRGLPIDPEAGPPIPGLPLAGARPTTRAVTQNLVPRGRQTSAPPLGTLPEPERAYDDIRGEPVPPPARLYDDIRGEPPPPAPDITIVDSKQPTPDRDANDDIGIVSLGPPPRMSDSQVFVLPNRPTPAQAVPRPQDGHSMVSMAVEAVVPASPAPVRTAAGGRPARPLSDLATEALVRPDEGDDRFEIGPGGNLVIRVVDRMLIRLEGVHVTGGDLTYELATRRTRGHQTEERFDHGGATLHVVSGRGYLIATPGKYTFEAVVLDDDILYLREDLVFAFESSLRWENGNVPGMRGRLPVVQFRGDGALALRLERPLVRVKLPLQGVVLVDAERLAGWIGRVIPRAVVPPTGGPLGAMCVECTGEGVVLVEPAPAPVPGQSGLPGLGDARRAGAAAPAAAPAAASDAQPSIPPELANLDDDQI